jgi:hypothetical protein
MGSRKMLLSISLCARQLFPCGCDFPRQRRCVHQRKGEVRDDFRRGAETVCRLLPRLALSRPGVNALSPLRSHEVIVYALSITLRRLSD